MDATPAQVALLQAVQTAPAVLFGLVAGACVDRVRRLPLLVWSDLGRALLLAAVPAAAAMGLLRAELLYLVGFLIGTLAILFDVSYRAFLPTVVGRDRLVEANAKMAQGGSVAQVVGPGLGGALVQALTAPFAVAADAASFLASAVSLAFIRSPEAQPAPAAVRSGVWREVGEGLTFVASEPILRALAGCTATAQFFGGMAGGLFLLYVTRHLGVEPAVLGGLLSLGSLATLPSAVLAQRVIERLGPGPSAVWSSVLISLVGAPVLVAGGAVEIVVALVGLTQVGFALVAPIYFVTITSLTQAAAPPEVLGRVGGTTRFLNTAATMLGTLAGGVLADAVGVWPVLTVGLLGQLTGAAWLVFSPVRTLRQMPTTSPPSP